MYQKQQSEKLDAQLFRHPTSEYRAAPFWAWNCKLDKQELLWQMDILKEMGIGGGISSGDVLGFRQRLDCAVGVCYDPCTAFPPHLQMHM